MLLSRVTSRRRKKIGAAHERLIAATMAPSKEAAEAAKAAGKPKGLKSTELTDFFKRKRVGRPKKRGNLPGDTIAPKEHKKHKRGPVPKPKPPPSKPSAKPPPTAKAPPEASEKKLVQKRVNWAKGEAKERLETAVNAWLSDGPSTFDDNGEKYSQKQFANVSKITYETFRKYTAANPEKRREISKSVGRSALLPEDDQCFVADISRLDMES